MKILGMLAAFIILFMFSANVLPAEREQKKTPPLSKQEVQKLRDIAVIIAGEITRRNIKSVTVTDFKDIKGNPSKMGKTASVEFRKQMEALGKTNFTIVDSRYDSQPSGGGALVTGMFLPFKGGDKWKLDIKVLSPDNRLIASYSGFFRKTKGVKK
ncbi:MAG: hypothetical protein L6246_10405 [Thermodesulfovibrionales bacterium]|nr:hypothetical protein [Nitrospinota bacterium]MCG2710709.1 hypothetical protein [Thermodesulfovibrionales bacterium]